MALHSHDAVTMFAAAVWKTVAGYTSLSTALDKRNVKLQIILYDK